MMVLKRTFTSIKYGQIICLIDHCDMCEAMCHIYSFSFSFTRLEKITTNFANILFDTVTYLFTFDIVPMKPESFMQISEAFPMLKYLTIKNRMVQL